MNKKKKPINNVRFTTSQTLRTTLLVLLYDIPTDTKTAVGTSGVDEKKNLEKIGYTFEYGKPKDNISTILVGSVKPNGSPAQ